VAAYIGWHCRSRANRHMTDGTTVLLSYTNNEIRNAECFCGYHQETMHEHLDYFEFRLSVSTTVFGSLQICNMDLPEPKFQSTIRKRLGTALMLKATQQHDSLYADGLTSMNMVRSLFLLVFSYASLDGAIRQDMTRIGSSTALEMFGFSALIGLAAFLLFKQANRESRNGKQWDFVAVSLATSMVMCGLCFLVPLVKVVMI